MHARPRSQLGRRRVAVLACLVWLFGVELLPDLHLALHDRIGAHVHDGDAPITTSGGLTVRVHRTTTAHLHAGAEHQHPGRLDAASPVTVDDQLDDAPAPPREHGRHSLAPRARARPPPAPLLPPPLPLDHRPLAVTHAIAQLVAIAPPPDASARAPPG